MSKRKTDSELSELMGVAVRNNLESREKKALKKAQRINIVIFLLFIAACAYMVSQIQADNKKKASMNVPNHQVVEK